MQSQQEKLNIAAEEGVIKANNKDFKVGPEANNTEPTYRKI